MSLLSKSFPFVGLLIIKHMKQSKTFILKDMNVQFANLE